MLALTGPVPGSWQGCRRLWTAAPELPEAPPARPRSARGSRRWVAELREDGLHVWQPALRQAAARGALEEEEGDIAAVTAAREVPEGAGVAHELLLQRAPVLLRAVAQRSLRH